MRLPILLLLVFASALASAQAPALLKFTDTAGYFTAEYPSNWINKIKDGNRVFFTSPAEHSSDNFFENINISVSLEDEEESEPELEEIFEATATELRKILPDYNEENKRSFKWNNVDAQEIIYTGTPQQEGSTKVRCKQWFCFYKSRLYIVSFVASADNSTHNATAEAIMKSVKFK